MVLSRFSVSQRLGCMTPHQLSFPDPGRTLPPVSYQPGLLSSEEEQKLAPFQAFVFQGFFGQSAGSGPLPG